MTPVARNTVPAMPPFDLIENQHFVPAFEQGMAEQMREELAIASNPDVASFDNTIVALELSGRLLTRVARVFFSLTSAHTNADLQVIQTELVPRYTSHNDSIRLNPELFSRLSILHQQQLLVLVSLHGLSLLF